jgi:hypothetical protein
MKGSEEFMKKKSTSKKSAVKSITVKSGARLPDAFFTKKSTKAPNLVREVAEDFQASLKRMKVFNRSCV